MNPLTDEQVEELWQAWQKNQCVQAVARACKVSHGTVTKYRRRGQWDKRLMRITALAEKKADETIANIRARWAKEARVLQQVGLSRFIDEETGKLDKEKLKKLSNYEAIQAIVAGVRLEREALGPRFDQEIADEFRPLIIRYVGNDNGDGVKEVESKVIENEEHPSP